MSLYLDLREPLPPLDDLMKDGGRLLIIEVLRRMPYAEYLQTNHWQSVRDETWRRCAGRCRQCGKRGHDVHHLSYEHIGCEKEDDTELLCAEHHRIFHENWQLKVRREGERQFS